MSEEELIETLKTFEEKRVEQLPESARNLFYAIMKIADERDEYKKEIERLNNIINEYVEDMEDYLNSDPPVDMQDYTHTVSDLEFLEEGSKELKFITTIRAKLQKLKGSDK